jgi:iron complex transport system ATP-binding protein
MIEVCGLTAFRGDRKVLTDVNFALESGKFLALVGPNGSGKSSLLQCLFQLIDYHGSVCVAGRSVAAMNRFDLAKVIGYLPQTVGNLPRFSVRHFVSLGRYVAGYRFRWLACPGDSTIIECMELTEVRSLADTLLQELSGGQLKRVLLAAVLAQQTPVLLLDEPTASLDPQQESRFFGVLKDAVAQRGCTVVLASHNLNQCVRAADVIIGLRAGEVCFQGAAAELAHGAGYLTSIFGVPFRLVNDPEHALPLVVPKVA